jgi:endonuclease YncB( thermonuclease family)
VSEYNYPQRDYIYDATMLKVQDGDTVYVKLDLGCDQKIEPMKLRLNGINAKGKTVKPTGVAAYNFLSDLFPVGSTLRVETLKDSKEKYGRYLGILHHPSLNQSVNDEMVARGLVEPYYGVGKASDTE